MSPRTALIVGNWKMYKTPSETTALVKEILSGLNSCAGRRVVVCPPFPCLPAAAAAAAGSTLGLGAQNVSPEEEGAYTGEVSVRMLADIGVQYVICGHSERRNLFGETDEIVRKKAARVLSAGLTPIVCVGENLAQREASETVNVVNRQVTASLEGLAGSLGRIVIAYEPVWAIGTGRNATPAQAQEVHAFIRKRLTEMAGGPVPGTPILYGGSVKPENIDELMRAPDIDGVLVGGASLNAASFLRIAGFRP